jgi:zinc transporter 1/2/3
MLPDAFNNFANPCLPAGWLSYGAFAGIFCMIASLLIQLIEFAAISNATAINQRKAEADNNSAVENYKATDDATERTTIDHKNHRSHELAGEHAHEIGHFHTAGMLEEGQSLRNIGTLTLELGIVMHSVIIGLTLANTGNDEFITLLIALVFHQVRIRLNALIC